MCRFLSTVLLLVFVTPLCAQKEFGFDNRKASGQPYWKPEESVAKMKVADGFEVKLFAAEPDVVNPIAMTVDEKGRVWVIECFEYPKRTAKGKMPRDRIVILEDTDGDGVCDKRTVFAEGKDFPVPFDLASGLEVGNGGVYVGAPPYLFFIENKNDKPGKFEILLKGFGSEDTHETLNTFQWGPDGWLYGLHGVFTNSVVSPYVAEKEKEPKGEPAAQARDAVKLNAGVWRFHPKTKTFEIFAEGTSNPWGMDWRNTDGQFILCCCVIPHLFHMVPGGNYKRQAGTSFNPYAYGEIKEICDHTFHKESGWAHAGLISLDTPIMPEKYRNSVIFGSIHGCSIKQNILKPNGSSYTASRGDDFLVSGDKNFRPINLRWGHNGEIYCIDWHDQNPCHQAKPEDLDYEHGRVYRIQPKGLKTKKAEDLGRLSNEQLAKRVASPNPYVFRTAFRLFRNRDIDWKKDGMSLLAAFEESCNEQKEPTEGMRAMLLVTSIVKPPPSTKAREPDLKESYAIQHKELEAQNGAAFGLRFMRSSRSEIPPWSARVLARMAEDNDSPILHREIASAAIVDVSELDISAVTHALMKYREDAKDPIIPQLLWTAYEKQLSKSLGKELDWLRDNCKDNQLITDTIIPRTMRRLVATGKAEDLAACVAFLGDLKDAAARQRALEGLVLALQNRQVDAPERWKEVRVALLNDSSKEIVNLTNRLAINFRDVEAVKRALGIATDAKLTLQQRMEAVRDLALAKPPTAIEPLLKIAKSDEANELRAEAIRALASFDDPNIAKELIAGYGKCARNLKGEIVNVLAGRKEWARLLLDAVGKKIVERTDLNDNTILRIQALKDKNLDAQVERVWGRIRSTPAELEALINKTRGQLYEARASFDRGKIAFDTHCAKCHKFDGRGHQVGPDIEGAGRDIEYLLINVLDPNRVIGAPYFMRTVTKLNGQNEIGVLHAEDDQTITLKTENAVLKVIAKKDIESIKVQEKSLMPEGFGSNIKIQEFRDLIRYTMANPFITEVEVTTIREEPLGTAAFSQPVVGVTGRILMPNCSDGRGVRIVAKVIAPEAMKTKLLLGIREDFMLEIDGKFVSKGAIDGSGKPAQADQVAIDVQLPKGESTIKIHFSTKRNGEAVYARFHDPDRKLRYPEPAEDKK